MPKLWLTYQCLQTRAAHPECFGADAAYVPLPARGSKADHAIGYARGERVVTIVPRWPIKLGDGWAGTTLDLPAGNWTNVLTAEPVSGGRVRLQTVLRSFPVALLVRNSEQ